MGGEFSDQKRAREELWLLRNDGEWQRYDGLRIRQQAGSWDATKGRGERLGYLI